MIDVSCKALVRRVTDDLDVIYKASNDVIDVIRNATVRRVTDDVAVSCKASVRRATVDIRCEAHWTGRGQ